MSLGLKRLRLLAGLGLSGVLLRVSSLIQGRVAVARDLRDSLQVGLDLGVARRVLAPGPGEVLGARRRRRAVPDALVVAASGPRRRAGVDE